jgi:hypothetical protein
MPDFDSDMAFPFGPAAKYAWPGGYPIGYLMDDGEFLCATCINENPEVHAGGDNDGWRLQGMQVLEDDWEKDTCAHCNDEFFPQENN